MHSCIEKTVYDRWAMAETVSGAIMARKNKLVELSDLTNAKRVVICIVSLLSCMSAALALYAWWLHIT